MHRLPVYVLVLLMAVAAVGCDTTEDDPSDAELFVGTWTLVELEDGEGDRMPLFNTIANGLTADLNADGSFEIFVAYKPASGNQPRTIPGTYTVEEGDGSLVLSPPTGQNIRFEYIFENDRRVNLSTPAAFVNALFGTDIYTGTVQLTITK